MISNGNRTEWSSIRSVIIQVIANFFITRMITDRIERVLPINHKNYNFREKKNIPSYERKGNFALKY